MSATQGAVMNPSSVVATAEQLIDGWELVVGLEVHV